MTTKTNNEWEEKAERACDIADEEPRLLVLRLFDVRFLLSFERQRLKQIVQTEIVKADKHEVAPLQRIMMELLEEYIT